MWPSCSPDLNPLDYRIWARMEQMIGKRRFTSIKQLIRAVKKAWASFTQQDLKQIVSKFRTRLEACIAARGANFEHMLG
jgi:hypothetical protein